MNQVRRPEQDPGFLADVRSTVHVLVERPLLPLVSLIVWTVPVLLPPALGLVAAPIWVFAVGYPGTERLWLLRGLRRQPFTFDQAFRRTWGYFGRFFRLELFIATPVAVGAGVGWLVSRTFLGLYLGLTAVAILLDFALTFVTPALAFSTRRAKEALAMGLRMIPSEWPRAALYVLVPPLAILLVAHLVP
ncbi:MAG: hypothetical protein E6G40_01555, partial [Actinobacteria bacterium]